MIDELVPIPTSLISLGGERPMHFAVDAGKNVPFAPPTDARPGEDRPLQALDLDHLRATLDIGRLPDELKPL